MKKALSILMALIMALGAFSALAFAEGDVNTYVTIANSKGSIVLALEKVAVTDSDNDGALTIADALYCAHAAKFDGGAEGFASAKTNFGLSLTKLWGETNNGSFGYYVNNAAAMSLGDTVKDGDKVYAFAYTDTKAWTDAYSYFSTDTLSAVQYDTVELTLSCITFDLETFSDVSMPVEGAKIIIDGSETTYVTDKDGKVSVELNKAGAYTVSAVSGSMTLVPPVCAAQVERAGIVATLSYLFNRFIEAITGFVARLFGN